MEKNAKKNKKKCSTFENLLSLISTTEPLQNIIPTDSESYSAGLQISFLMILGNWSCDHPPNNPEIPEREKMKYRKYCPR